MEANFNSKTFLFICIYRPPQSNFNHFHNKLNEILNLSKDKTYSDIFIFGDINLDLFQHIDNNNVQESVNTMYTYSLYPLTTLSTRVTATSSTLIDHIWSSQTEKSETNYISKTDITDHYPVISTFKYDEHLLPKPSYLIKKNNQSESCEAVLQFSLKD